MGSAVIVGAEVGSELGNVVGVKVIEGRVLGASDIDGCILEEG